MSYIGKAPGFGIRNRYYYTATATQTLFSGADDNGQTLAYADSKYLDVFLNGVLLVAGTDYTATTLTSVSLTSGAAADDIIEIVAYDIFSVADTVSAANGGTFNGAVTVDSTLTASGLVTAQDGLVVDNDGATVATFDRATSDGTIVDLQKDGSSVGSIGTSGGRMRVNSGSVNGSGISFNANFISPTDKDGTNNDNVVDLGYPTLRFKDLYLSGGVYLGGTGSANYLDDYEEGDWTATFAGSASTATGKYVKTGALVHVQVFATLNVTSSVNAVISGLPFPVITYSVGTATHNNYTTNGDQGFFTSGASTFTLMVDNQVTVATTSTGNPKYIMMAGTYYTTS